jgi:hypothetical protein
MGLPAVTFVMPSANWALAVLHGSRLFDQLEDTELTLPPSWFLAAALNSTAMGCFDYGDLYTQDASTFDAGCLEINAGTWDEVCAVYTDEWDCDAVSRSVAISTADQDLDGLDHAEPSVMTLTWYAVSSYAQLTRSGVAEVDAWFEDANDPQAVVKVMALIHQYSPWEPSLRTILADCQHLPIEACLDATSHTYKYTVAVAGHVTDLEASLAGESCYDQDLSETDVRSYVANLAVLWPDIDVPTLQDAASAALIRAPEPRFQVAATAVLDAVDAGLGRTLRCPETQLRRRYGLGCF